mmetsp:Transcript_95797/g.298772  ORF Transcript_95797/g.298772 Transcript_95797/m.298772 type:complete len:122 (+) Transcript_95797:177-542(+)
MPAPAGEEEGKGARPVPEPLQSAQSGACSPPSTPSPTRKSCLRRTDGESMARSNEVVGRTTSVQFKEEGPEVHEVQAFLTNWDEHPGFIDDDGELWDGQQDAQGCGCSKAQGESCCACALQ